jgi:NTE family protein
LKKGESRLLLVAVDIQEAAAVVFDNYEKQDGTRKSEYGRYGRLKSTDSTNDYGNEGFEHVIRYNDGITSDFVLASCSVPVNYDYTKLNVETRNLDTDWQEGNDSVARRDKDRSSYNSSGGSSGVRFFWDGGLLANTPLRQTYLAHRQYWLHVRKLEYNIPRLHKNQESSCQG